MAAPMARHLQANLAANLAIEEVLKKLASDRGGISQAEAKSRLEQLGPNEMHEERTHPLVRFLRHFWGPISWMIEAACVLAAIAGRWDDFRVIFALLAVNGGVSYWQERKAERAIRDPKEGSVRAVFVLRDGESRRTDARELVPGDVVVVHAGDMVPADAKLLDDQRIGVDESALTGESLPVDKEPAEMIYFGTAAVRGKARAVVVATGDHTESARMVALGESAGAESHFDKAVLKMGNFLIVSAAALVGIVIVSLLVHHARFWTMVVLAMGLILAAIPAALPPVLSVIMGVGANRLARMKAIVSQLSVMDEMAGLDVLCTGKTGTLTRNRLSLQEPVLVETNDRDELTLTAALTVDRAQPARIDRAILDALDNQQALDAYQVKELRLFEGTPGRAEADVTKGDEAFTAAVGAPQVILDLREASDSLRAKVSDKVDELARDGCLAVGVARKDASNGWRYLGLLGVVDPLREDCEEMVGRARAYGISVRLVTGDCPAIGRPIAGQVGLGDDILDAAAVFGDLCENVERLDASIHEKVVGADGFASATPERKRGIIKHLQADDHIVGMVGRGANDVAALMQADVGIAAAGAAHVARTAAALVLGAPNLSVIIKALEEARRVFERMRSYATYRITETIRLVLFIAGSVLVLGFSPLTPLAIVLLTILNDIPIMTIAWDHVRLSQRPARWAIRDILIMSNVLGVAGVASTFLLYWYVRGRLGLGEETVRTIVFLKLLVAAHMTLYIARAVGWFWQRPWPSLSLLVSLEATQVFGTLAAVYGVLMAPIGWKWAGVVWGYAFVWMFVLDAMRVGVRWTLREHTRPGTGANEQVEPGGDRA